MGGGGGGGGGQWLRRQRWRVGSSAQRRRSKRGRASEGIVGWLVLAALAGCTTVLVGRVVEAGCVAGQYSLPSCNFSGVCASGGLCFSCSPGSYGTGGKFYYAFMTERTEFIPC